MTSRVDVRIKILRDFETRLMSRLSSGEPSDTTRAEAMLTQVRAKIAEHQGRGDMHCSKCFKIVCTCDKGED